MNNKEKVLQEIKGQGLLPLFYHEDAAVCLEVISTLYHAGVRVIEYTNRGPAALENFKVLVSEVNVKMPGLQLGIGTIKNTTEADAFIAAGAHFIVCPVIDTAIAEKVHAAGRLWVPGCFSPTEINVAHQAGAGLIKLFPANVLGPSYVSAIKDLFPGQLFIPTGGVEIEAGNLKAWFDSGVCAVGMGSKLISKEILAARNYDKLFTLTQTSLKLILESRKS